ncbi:MAG TPA: condensation domain-containing protein, partial [Allosphingosinicella sp.]|nr:condensation domain-containing protein [Allosphingosinicella sp.]
MSLSFPLSPTQLDVLIEQNFSPDVPMHNVGLHFPIRGELCIKRFFAAIESVVRSSDALSAALAPGDDIPLQRVVTKGELPLRRLHVMSMDEALEWMAVDFDVPFELYGDYLFRFALIPLADGGYLFYTVFHHLIVDAAGVLLMMQRIRDAYRALAADEQPQGSFPRYGDFVQADHDYWASEAFRKAEAFWKHRFAELPEQLPKLGGAKTAGADEVRSHKIGLSLPRASFDRLQAHFRPAKATSSQLFTALLYGFFGRMWGVSDLAVGVARLNRGTDQFRQTIGTFANISPVRIAGGTTLAETLAAIHRDLAEVWEHRHFPTSALNRALNLLDKGREQLFDISLAYIQGGVARLELGDATIGAPKVLTSGYDRGALQAFVSDNPGEPLYVELICSRRYIEPARAALLGTQFTAFVEALSCDPDRCFRDFDILLAEERERLLVEWNRTERPLPGGLVHELIAQAAARSPEAVAVRSGDASLTYGELDARSNRLARHLQSLG